MRAHVSSHSSSDDSLHPLVAMRVSLKRAKRSFNIHAMLRRIRQEVKQFADAAMFDLAEQGYATPFHQLVACIISVRTRDEVSLPEWDRTAPTSPLGSRAARLRSASTSMSIASRTDGVTSRPRRRRSRVSPSRKSCRESRALPPGRSDGAPLIYREIIRPIHAYSSLDLLPAICAKVSPVKRKLVQSSIAFAPICL